VRPGFALSADNAADVAAICRRLDGIPLALELAAARIADLAPREIVTRLTGRFRLLTGGRRGLQRQQTLQAALDWSHDLLTEPERVLLRRLSVFAGGWTLDAARAVCSGRSLDPDQVDDLLGTLVRRSLVDAEHREEHTRYRLLETVRIYAQERLIRAEEAPSVRDAHAEWFLHRAETPPGGTAIAGIRYWFGFQSPDLVDDLDNLRDAADWSLAQGRRDVRLRIAAATTRALQSQGRIDEADWLDLAIPDAAEMPSMQGASLTAHYRAATIEEVVGGDWYDAFDGPDGRVYMVVGDVESEAVRRRLHTERGSEPGEEGVDAVGGDPSAGVRDPVRE